MVRMCVLPIRWTLIINVPKRCACAVTSCFVLGNDCDNKKRWFSDSMCKSNTVNTFCL